MDKTLINFTQTLDECIYPREYIPFRNHSDSSLRVHLHITVIAIWSIEIYFHINSIVMALSWFFLNLQFYFKIERLWRDVWTGCVSLFYNIFCRMEAEGVFIADNDLHLKALHYVFIPRIQHHLDAFINAYIRKPLWTANSRSPIQLWISGQAVDPTTDLGMVMYLLLNIQ